jgi:hypothetical protein
MRDARASDHDFDRNERCLACGISREVFDGSGQRCFTRQLSKNRTSRAPSKSKKPSVDGRRLGTTGDWE